MEKEVSRAAVLFEEEARSGIAADTRSRVADYAGLCHSAEGSAPESNGKPWSGIKAF